MTQRDRTNVVTGLQSVAEDLLATTAASRITIRLNLPDCGFDTTIPAAEAMMPGVNSLKGTPRENQDRSGTVQFLKRERRLLVQDDLVNADPDALPPSQLITDYGTLAQMLGGVYVNDELIGWVSVHENRGTRAWKPEEAAALERAVTRATEIVNGG